MSERTHDYDMAPTRAYRCNEASFELPLALKDKTVHVFALEDEGPNEFNLVISRASADADVTLDEFADRLTIELRRALPKFQLKRRQEAAIDGAAAIELFYAWSNNGVVMQQRQTVTFVHGPAPEQPQALMIAGTCLNGFSERWHLAYDQLLAGMKLDRPWAPPEAAGATQAQPVEALALPGTPDPSRFAFGLAHDGTLLVYSSIEAMIEETDPADVQAGQWKFYDVDGHPLQPVWQQALGAPPQGVAGFQLRRAEPGAGLGPLQNRLATIDRVRGLMHDLAAVHRHLLDGSRPPHA